MWMGHQRSIRHYNIFVFQDTRIPLYRSYRHACITITITYWSISLYDYRVPANPPINNSILNLHQSQVPELYPSVHHLVVIGWAFIANTDMIITFDTWITIATSQYIQIYSYTWYPIIIMLSHVVRICQEPVHWYFLFKMHTEPNKYKNTNHRWPEVLVRYRYQTLCFSNG